MAEASIGLLGATFLLLGWMVTMYHTVKDRRSVGAMGFFLMYLIGAALLTWYSVQLNDVPFVILNGAAAIIAAVNLFYLPNKRRATEKEVAEIEKVLHIAKKGAKRGKRR
jgi:lipid-A-disaccharide synthase-like uncharacterized protein